MKPKYLVSLFILASSMSAMAMHHSNACQAVVKTCMTAGYSRVEGNKNIWMHCIKPVILGQTVKDVSVDPTVVKNCRLDKIKEMKKELEEFEKVS